MVVEYTDHYLETLEAHSRGVYPNFIEGSEAQKLTTQAFSPETYRRLKDLKAQFDPDNRFRYGLQF